MSNDRSQETLKNVKIQWDAAEKARRQKWTAQRAQEIKENTLKSNHAILPWIQNRRNTVTINPTALLSVWFWLRYMTNWISIIVVKTGVEPEIQRLLNLHKDEVRQVQEHYESLTKDSDGRAEEKYREKLRAIDAAVVQRIEDVRQQERQLAEQM